MSECVNWFTAGVLAAVVAYWLGYASVRLARRKVKP